MDNYWVVNKPFCHLGPIFWAQKLWIVGKQNYGGLIIVTSSANSNAHLNAALLCVKTRIQSLAQTCILRMCSKTNLSTVNNGVSEGPSIEKAFLWFLQMFHLGAALLSHKCDAAKISTGLAIACCLMYISSHLISFLFSFLSPPKMTSRARSRPPMRGNAIFPTHTDLSIIRGEKITRQKITGQRLKSGLLPP